MAKVEATVENIQQAAKNYPQLKGVLKTLFPAAFPDNSELPFCNTGQLLKRKGFNHFYSIVPTGRKNLGGQHEFGLLNISCTGWWRNKIFLPQKNVMITYAGLAELLQGTGVEINEFAVLREVKL